MKNGNVLIIKYFNVNDFSEEDIDFTIDILKKNNNLSIDRINKSSEFKDVLSKKHSVLANLLIDLNLGIKAKYIYYNKKDKPLINGVYFSVSHSKDYVIFAKSDDKIGIDVECISIKNESILNYAFEDDEKRYIKETHSDNIAEGITKFWTMKEAIFKASGVEDSVEPKNIILNTNNLNKVVFKNEELNLITKRHQNYYISIASVIKYDDFILENEKLI